MSTAFQSFLDGNKLIDRSDFTEKEKEDEKTKILEARKLAFDDDFQFVSPWRKR